MTCALLIGFIVLSDAICVALDDTGCDASSNTCRSAACVGIGCLRLVYDDTDGVRDTSLGRAGVYGEITEAGVASMLSSLRLTHAVGTFMDIGSGNGKMVAHVALSTTLRSIGVELSEARHAKALQLQQTIFANVGELYETELRHRMKFVHADASNVSFEDASIIYMNSQCFPKTLLRHLAFHIQESAPNGTLVLSVLPLPGCARGYFLLGFIHVEQTWQDQVPLFVYLTAGAPLPAVEKILQLSGASGSSVHHSFREAFELGNGSADWEGYSRASQLGIASSAEECETWDRLDSEAETAAATKKPQCNKHCYSQAQCILSSCGGCNFCKT